jgi:hypothetical protein
MGQQCLGYDHQTGNPQKLRRTSRSDICEFCQRARSKEEIAAADEPKKREQPRAEDVELEAYKNALEVQDLTLLKSSAAAKLYRLQENLLVEHCLRQGDFWEAIKARRVRWSTTPTEAVPPEDPYVPNPLTKPREVSDEEQNKPYTGWLEDLSSVTQRFFPERPDGVLGQSRFVACCAFYDPPRDNLFGFFQACVASPGLVLPEGWETRKDEPLVAMSGLPVEKLPNPGAVAAAWRIYYEGIIQELGERHLKSRGLNVQELVEDVLNNRPELSRNLDARLQMANEEASEYIKVDDDTTRDDILGAARFITQSPEPRKGGRPPRSRLVAVQYAILVDEYGWTYRQIAEKFEGPTDDTFLRRVEAHVNIGREILEKG